MVQPSMVQLECSVVYGAALVKCGVWCSVSLAWSKDVSLAWSKRAAERGADAAERGAICSRKACRGCFKM